MQELNMVEVDEVSGGATIREVGIVVGGALRSAWDFGKWVFSDTSGDILGGCGS